MSQILNPSGAYDQTARLGLVLNTFDDLMDHGRGLVETPVAIIDEFEDATGIDAGNSTGETYDGSSSYSNPGGYTADQASGGSVVASATDGGYPAANAFADDGASSAWRSDDSGGAVNGTSHIGYNFGSAKGVRRIRLLQGATGLGWSNNGNASSIIVRTSPDGATWTNRETISSLSTSNNSDAWEVIDLASDYGDHQYWDLLLNSAIGTGRWHVAEVEFLDLQTPAALDLRSVGVALGITPATAYFVGKFSSSDPDAVYVSSDDGVTWDAVTLTDYGDYGSGVTLFAGQVSLTGGGSTARIRATKAAGTECAVEAWGAVFG